MAVSLSVDSAYRGHRKNIVNLDSFNALIRLYRVTHRTANLLNILGDYADICGPAHKETRELAAMWTAIDKAIGKHLDLNQKTRGANEKEETMATEINNGFPEVKGKTVETIEISVESEYYGITIYFQDNTSLSFTIESHVSASPVYSQWENGEEKIIKEYEPVYSGTDQE